MTRLLRPLRALVASLCRPRRSRPRVEGIVPLAAHLESPLLDGAEVLVRHLADLPVAADARLEEVRYDDDGAVLTYTTGASPRALWAAYRDALSGHDTLGAAEDAHGGTLMLARGDRRLDVEVAPGRVTLWSRGWTEAPMDDALWRHGPLREIPSPASAVPLRFAAEPRGLRAELRSGATAAAWRDALAAAGWSSSASEIWTRGGRTVRVRPGVGGTVVLYAPLV